MDLISYYARLVATLNPILTDIAPQLVEMLIKDFKFQVSHLYVIISTVDLSFCFTGFQEGPNAHSVQTKNLQVHRSVV